MPGWIAWDMDLETLLVRSTRRELVAEVTKGDWRKRPRIIRHNAHEYEYRGPVYKDSVYGPETIYMMALEKVKASAHYQFLLDACRERAIQLCADS